MFRYLSSMQNGRLRRGHGTLGWSWLSVSYHPVQLALSSRLTWHIWPRKGPRFLLTTLPLCYVWNSSCPHAGAVRRDQESWVLLIFMSDLEKSTQAHFLEWNSRNPEGWGGLLCIPDPGSGEFPVHVTVNNTLRVTLASLFLGFYLACFSLALVTRTTLVISRYAPLSFLL